MPVMRSRRGSIAPVIGLAFPLLLGMLAMSVDWGQVSVARFALRGAADEAALAAASALKSRPTTADEIAEAQGLAETRAEAYANRFSMNQMTFEVETVTLGYHNKADGVSFTTTIPNEKSPNAVQVTTSTTVHLGFSSFFGVGDVTIRNASRAGAGVVPARAPDLAIVQDVTPSMSATDIANSKDANKALVSCIKKNARSDTRGAFVRFANIDHTVVPLVSYEDAPTQVYNAAAGTSPITAYSNGGICVGGMCTSHSAGLYAGVSLLNAATAPPDDVGQAILMITDGAPATNSGGCSLVASASGTAYQQWLVGSASGRCGQLAAQGSAAGCANVGGRWQNSKCYPSDNGAESGGAAGPGKCSLGPGYGTEVRCEGAGGTWQRNGSTVANPSSMTRWTDEAKALAAGGTHGPIDVYVVFYSSGATTTYKADNTTFLTNHVVSGKGAELGVLDAPSGDGLTAALESICEAYVVSAPGLIE